MDYLLNLAKQSEADLYRSPCPTEWVHRRWPAEVARDNRVTWRRPQGVQQCPETLPQRHASRHQGENITFLHHNSHDTFSSTVMKLFK